MKIRQIAEDFCVEEVLKYQLVPKGEYKLFSLEKKNVETFSLINDIAKRNRIPSKEIGIAGLKDRGAFTKQYFTIPSQYDLVFDRIDVRIKFIGFVDNPISLGDLEGNNFTITVRDIKKGEIDGIYQKGDLIVKYGVPNYFDSQRFGSVVEKEFIAREILRKNYKKAVELYLMNVNPNDRLVEEIYDEGNYLEAYRTIDYNMKRMFVSAYQSYLWNECIKELLWRIVDKKRLYSLDYDIGSLTFYKELSESEMKKLPKKFMALSERTKLKGIDAEIVKKVLDKEKISLTDFNIRKETDNFFKEHGRNVLIFPGKFTMSKEELDELNNVGELKKRFKMEISFFLPKGSYATIIIKKMFNI